MTSQSTPPPTAPPGGSNGPGGSGSGRSGPGGFGPGGFGPGGFGPENPDPDDFAPEELEDLTDRLIDIVMGWLEDDKGVHAESAIAAAGFLAGEYLLRAGILDRQNDPAPGSSVADPWVETKLIELCDAVLEVMENHEIEVIGLAEIEPDHFPLDEPARLVCRMRTDFDRTLAEEEIDGEERFWTAALVAGRLVMSAAEVLDPAIGAAIEIKAAIWGAHTVPLQDPEGELDGAPSFFESSAEIGL